MNKATIGLPGLSRENNPNWKGGKTISSHGYLLVKVDESKYSTIANGYAYEHRYIMEKLLCRKLKSREIVHHLDGNKLNNSIENLILCNENGEHFVYHRKHNDRRLPGESNHEIACPVCNEKLLKYDKYNRPRKYHFGCSPAKGTGKKVATMLIKCKCGCEETINAYDKYGRRRNYISGHNLNTIRRKNVA